MNRLILGTALIFGLAGTANAASVSVSDAKNPLEVASPAPKTGEVSMTGFSTNLLSGNDFLDLRKPAKITDGFGAAEKKEGSSLPAAFGTSTAGLPR